MQATRWHLPWAVLLEHFIQMAQRKISVSRQANSTFNAASHSEDAGAPTHKQKLWIPHVSMDTSITLSWMSCCTASTASVKQDMHHSSPTNTYGKLFFCKLCELLQQIHTHLQYNSIIINLKFMLFDKDKNISSLQWMEECYYLRGCPGASVSLRVNERWNWGFIYHQ